MTKTPENKLIRLNAHAQGYVRSRGFTESEVVDTIRTTPWQNADLGKKEAQKEFPYAEEWHGKRYQTKQVRPIFVEEEEEIVVITVYTYYY